jgi:hypothetical protein
MPAMQNDGIVIGSPSSASTMYGTQVTGNRIANLSGAGISAPPTALLLETVIARNQLLNLGGMGIILSGLALDVDIAGNSLLSIGQLAIGQPATDETVIASIQIQGAIDVNISENRIEGLGPKFNVLDVSRRGIYVVAVKETRIAGNQITDIGPTTSTSMGIYAPAAFGRLDVADNDVRRAATPPAKPDETIWFALNAVCETITVQGNLLESFGGNTDLPGAVLINASQSCIFSNNQCFLDDPAGTGHPLVVAIQSKQSIIAMGNMVEGPTEAGTDNPPPSVTLTAGSKKIPQVTAIGNITSSGITVQPGGMPAAMKPLNIITS